MRSVHQINNKQYNSGSKCIFYCNLCLSIYMNMVSCWAASFFADDYVIDRSILPSLIIKQSTFHLQIASQH